MTLTSRFILLIASAAVAPLLIYGGISVRSLRSGAEQSVNAGNLAVATQTAHRIEEYSTTTVGCWADRGTTRGHAARAVAAGAHPSQSRDRLFGVQRDHRLHRRRPRHRDQSNDRAGARGAVGANGEGEVRIASPSLDHDNLPTTTMGVAVNGATARWVLAEISLEKLWSAVDAIVVGQTGFVVLLDDAGRIIAHGRADEKRLIAGRATETPEQQLAAQLRAQKTGMVTGRVKSPTGERRLAVATAVKNPAWTVVVEQPVEEALGVAHELERQLLAAITLALLATVIAGSMWGRSFIRASSP